MEQKSIWLSKTFWVNLITLIVAILGIVSQSPLLTDHPQVVAYILAGVSTLNLVLRWFTDSPLFIWRS